MDDVVRELGRAAYEVGYDAYSEELSAVAGRVRELGLS